MIWTKTDAGRAEMKSHARLTDRLQRTLLLLIDGAKSEALLLDHVKGITPAHFQTLRALGLIEPAGRPSPGSAAARAELLPDEPALAPPLVPSLAPESDPEDLPLEEMPVSPAERVADFASALRDVITRDLGLRGASLADEVERATTLEALDEIAQRVIWQVRDKHGAAAAERATRQLLE